MMKFQTEWKNKSHVPNHQPAKYVFVEFAIDKWGCTREYMRTLQKKDVRK